MEEEKNYREESYKVQVSNYVIATIEVPARYQFGTQRETKREQRWKIFWKRKLGLHDSCSCCTPI